MQTRFNSNENDLLTKNWQVSYVTKATADNENNTAARIKSGWGAFSKEIPLIEKDRPIKITFDYTAGSSVRVVMNSTADAASVNSQSIVTITNYSLEEWRHTSSVRYGNLEHITNDLSDRNHTSSVDIEKLIFFSDSATETKDVYVDNIMLVPGYKINYDANGGTGSVEPDYFMEGTYSDLANGSSLTSDKGDFAGWSLAPDGEVVTSVTGVPGSDITLYAIYKDYSGMAPFTYELTSTTAGVANGVMTFVAPSAYHTEASVYFANDEGVMAEYTEFVKVNFANRVTTYTVSGNRSFAMGATKLSVVFSGNGAENETVEYTIPEANRLASKAPLYKYFVVSDLHLGGSATNIDYFYMQWSNSDPIRTRAMGGGSNNRQGDVFAHDADFVIVNGDLVNYGSYYRDDDSDKDGQPDGEVGEARYWDVLDSYIENRLNIHSIPVFLTNGNHEFQKQNSSEQNLASFIPTRLNSAIMGQVDYISENYGEDVVITKDKTNPDALYYAADMYGAKYIFMSTPEMSEDKTGSSHTVSAKQLKFLDEQLYDGEKSDKTVYIITHLPIEDIDNETAVKAILAKHPNAIVFESHTHDNLALDKNYTIVGDITTSNTGALSYLVPKVNDSYVTSYNVGQFVEVYEDMVIIKARKFADKSQFFGHALYIVDTAKDEAFDATIEGTVAYGNTVSAFVNGAAAEEGYTYEWIICGETVSTESTLALNDRSLAGNKIILRVTAENGTYASCVSDTVIVDTVTLQTASIRTKDPQGMRFAGYVSETVRNSGEVEEYGYIIGLAKKFENGDYSTLKFNANGDRSGTLDDVAGNYVSAPAFVNNGTDYSTLYSVEGAKEVAGFKDEVLANVTDDGYYYTAVLTGIPKANYKDALVGKTYIKVNGEYYYGDAIVRNIYDLAQAYADKYEAEGKDVPEYIASILAAN